MKFYTRGIYKILLNIFYLFAVWSSEGHIFLKGVNRITFRRVL